MDTASNSQPQELDLPVPKKGTKKEQEQYERKHGVQAPEGFGEGGENDGIIP